MSDAPIGWSSAHIYELLQTQSDGKLVHQGWSPQCESIPATSPDDWAALKTTAIQDGKFLPQHNKRLPKSLDPKPRIEVKAGDLLLTCAGPRIRCGVACLVRETKPNLMISGKMYRFRPLENAIDPRYLEAFLRTPETKAKIDGMKTGISESGMNITHEKFSQLVLPLAPLAEQKRIADKLDTLLSRVDACRERLDRVPTLIKRFKQSVLAAATSGKLTEDWRGGKDIEWSFERAADVCTKVQSGGTPKEGFTDSPGIPFLKVYNIVDQQVAFDYKPQFVSLASHARALSKSITFPGDVLMNIVGPPLGKVAVVPFDHPQWNINQAITLFRPSDRISTGWLYCILCGGSNIEEIVNETRGSAGQTNISLSQCRDFVFPVPSPEEQAELVRRVGKLFTFADRLQAKLANATNQVQRLTPSLLAKAFRGELVPQDPNDEPAQKMLERLKTAKSGEPIKATSRGRKRTATT